MSGGVAVKAFHYTYDDADNRLTEQAGTTPRSFAAYSGSLNLLNSQTASGPLRVSGAVSASSTVTVNGQNATPLGAATVFSADLPNQTAGNLALTVVATTAGAGSNTATATYHVNVKGTRGHTLTLERGRPGERRTRNASKRQSTPVTASCHALYFPSPLRSVRSGSDPGGGGIKEAKSRGLN